MSKNNGGLGDLSALLGSTNTEEVVDLSLQLIDEDPAQPRKDDNAGFTAESIKSLASTIQTEGLIHPIIVKHSSTEGRYIIVDGARRYRAHIVAGYDIIQVIIRDKTTLLTQFIANIHNENHTAQEITRVIEFLLEEGLKKSEIATAVGKSNSWVSQYAILLKLPASIQTVFDSGRCVDVTVINEIVKLHKKYSKEVDDWLSRLDQDVTRGSVKMLKDYLSDIETTGADENESEHEDETVQHDESEKSPPPPPEELTSSVKLVRKRKDDSILKKPLMICEYDKRSAIIILNKRPSDYGRAWIEFEDSGKQEDVLLEHLSLIGVVEA